MNYTIILALMGGLGLFLYGMKLMSDGLEKAAGAKLRRILEIFTTNRLTGMLVGIFFTAVIQSSSASTVIWLLELFFVLTLVLLLLPSLFLLTFLRLPLSF